MPVEATSYLNTAGLQTGTREPAKGTLDKDGFLKLLTAQLANQDPQASQDPNQYFQTISQMSIVEQLTNLAGSSEQQAKQQQASDAAAMIGHTVRYLDAAGEQVTGTLESVQIGKSEATVTIGGVAGISTNLITEVS